MRQRQMQGLASSIGCARVLMHVCMDRLRAAASGGHLGADKSVLGSRCKLCTTLRVLRAMIFRLKELGSTPSGCQG